LKTLINFEKESSKPEEKRRRIIPISDSFDIKEACGKKDPKTIPEIRYPTMGWALNFFATNPPREAKIKTKITNKKTGSGINLSLN